MKQALATIFGHILYWMFTAAGWIGLFLFVHDNWEWHVVQQYETASLTNAQIVTILVIYRLLRPFYFPKPEEDKTTLGDKLEMKVFHIGIIALCYGVTYAAQRWM